MKIKEVDLIAHRPNYAVNVKISKNLKEKLMYISKHTEMTQSNVICGLIEEFYKEIKGGEKNVNGR
jgi:predicted DNA-binding protein